MNVKLQALLNAAKWVESEYGESALRAVLERCPPEIAARLESGIAIEWIASRDVCRFYESIVEVLGRGDRKILKACGAFSARRNMQSFATRMAAWILTPEFVFRRSEALWRQYNDEGELKLVTFEPGICRIEIARVPTPHWGMCTSLEGWCEELSKAVGWRDVVATHVECRVREDARCLYEIRYRP